MLSLSNFQAAIGFKFNNILLLQKALTHRSYLNEYPEHPMPHNERLEFLGDAVIDFLVGEYLFDNLPEMREGEMTSWRAAIVRMEGLARFAEEINLGAQVIMGRGEEASGARERMSLLADSFEALLAAMYLDQGMQAVRQWVTPFMAPATTELLQQGGDKDPKSYLQEVAQAHVGITPHYKVINEIGPDHERHYTTQVLIGDDVYGTGKGRTKQIAAQKAAKKALKRFGVRFVP
ncbi:MAG: ribonuclease III [Ardenticatenaceae bacterium]